MQLTEQQHQLIRTHQPLRLDMGTSIVEFSNGDLFQSDAIVLINTVNTVGVPGKGIALAFAQRYPKETEVYKRACRSGALVVGKVLYVKAANGKVIVFTPTKVHWRNPSQMAYIKASLKALLELTEGLGFKSVACPALGCTNGQLNWHDVYPEILNTVEQANNQQWTVYYPKG